MYSTSVHSRSGEISGNLRYPRTTNQSEGIASAYSLPPYLIIVRGEIAWRRTRANQIIGSTGCRTLHTPGIWGMRVRRQVPRMHLSHRGWYGP